MLGLKVKSLEFNEHGVKITVHGKTGPRRILLVASSPYLAQWLNDHAEKDNPESPLWLRLRKKRGRPANEVLDYNGLRVLLKRIGAKAGIKKRIHAHLFRHSRATHLSKLLKEAQMNEIFGWVQGSSMPSVYVHLSGRDVDDAILQIYGIKDRANEERESKLKPRECQRCKEVNPATNTFCARCSAPLDMTTAIHLEERRQVPDNFFFLLLDDAKVRERARELLTTNKALQQKFAEIFGQRDQPPEHKHTGQTRKTRR